MAEYRSNSNRSREMGDAAKAPERKTEKVVTGVARTQKKSSVRKMLNAVFPGDVGKVGEYVFVDRLVPIVQNALREILFDSIDIMLGGSGRRGSRNPSGRVSYGSYYDDRNDRSQKNRARLSSTYDFDDVVFDSRADAEEVLYRMEEMLNEFHNVSVGDMYDMAGITCDYTANKYGWTDLRNARIERVGSGWRINLPMPMLI